MSDQDLREQVARLLWKSAASNEARALGWDGMDTTTRERYWNAASAVLPLFAARERAAAEKALEPDEWREILASLHDEYEEGMVSDAEPSAGDKAFFRGFEKLSSLGNRYIVRARLKGEEA